MPTGSIEKQAKAVAQRFYDTVAEMYHTNDPKAMLELAVGGCSACENYASAVTDNKANGQHVEYDGKYVVRDVKVLDSGPLVKINYTLDLPAAKIVDEQGNVANSVDPKTVRGQMLLSKVEGKWLVADDYDR